MTVPTLCPAGYFCPASSGGLTDSNKCPIGFYSTFTGLYMSSQCQACPSGKYCNSIGQTAVTGSCSAGYWCWYGSNTAASASTVNSLPGRYYGKCPPYHYCPAGTGYGIPSLQGYYDATTGRSAQSQFAVSVAGRFSNTVVGYLSATMTSGVCL